MCQYRIRGRGSKTAPGAGLRAVLYRKPAGLGMGLSIVRLIIEAHGGVIGVTNNPTCGATFSFICRGPVADQRELKRLLRSAGYRVETSTSGGKMTLQVHTASCCRLFILFQEGEHMAEQPFVTDIQTLRARARQHIEQGAVTPGYRAHRETVIRLLNEALPRRLSVSYAISATTSWRRASMRRVWRRSFYSTLTMNKRMLTNLPSASCNQGGAPNFSRWPDNPEPLRIH